MADTTEKQILASVKDGVSRKIRSEWTKLRFVLMDASSTDKIELPDEPPKSNALMGAPGTDELGIAGDAIINRQVTLTDKAGKKHTLTLKQLDERIVAFAKAHPEYHLTGFGKLEDEVYTAQTIKKVADATDKGVENASGFGSQAMGFIKGFMTWIASFVKSLFSGGKEKALGFWEAIAQSAAPDARDTVKGSLQTLALADPAAARLLRERDAQERTTLDVIGGKVYDGAVERLTGVAPAVVASTAPPLDAVQPLPIDGISPAELRKKIVEGIVDPKDDKGQPAKDKEGNSLRPDVIMAKKFKEGRNNSWWGWSAIAVGYTDSYMDATAAKTTNFIADTVAGFLIDPKSVDPLSGKKLSELKDNPEALAKAVKAKVDQELVKHEKELGLPLKLAEKGGDKDHPEKTFQEMLTERIPAGIIGNHHELKVVLELVNPSAQKVAANSGVQPNQNIKPTTRPGDPNHPDGQRQPGVTPAKPAQPTQYSYFHP